MKRYLLLALALLYVPAALGQYTRWDGYLTNAQGQAIQGAQVYILTQPATVSAYSPQAPVFSSVTGGALTQPLHTDGFGHAYAYVTETVNAAACNVEGSLCYTIVYISKSTGQVVLPDQVVGGGGGGTPPSSGCTPTGGGPYPTASGQGEMLQLTNDGTGCTSNLNLTNSIGDGGDSTLWFRDNGNIEMDSQVDPNGEQTLIQPTFWQMTSSTQNGPAQINLAIDDSGWTGGGNPLLIQMGIITDTPGAGWEGIDLQPAIGGASKNKDLDSILIESMSAHFGQTMRKYHGMKIQMNAVGGSTETDGLVIEAQNSLIPANYCDVITREDSGATRVSLGCGTTHASTFGGPVSVAAPFTVTGSGAAMLKATEGTPCDSPAAGSDLMCADNVAHAMTFSNNGGAYFTPAKTNTCGTTTTCANTAQNNPRQVWGTVALSGGTAVVASMTAWTSTSSFVCTATDYTAAAAVKIVNTSTSSITITGTGTDTIAYQCIGN